jgi:uroporphyrinogen III methyltransferase / synthase
MSNQSIHIISHLDKVHQDFIDELKNRFPDLDINASFLKNDLSQKLSNISPVLEILNDETALLNLNALPFPLTDSIRVLSVIKSEVQANEYFAFLTKDFSSEKLEIFASLDERNQFGKVYLVGAGQSDKEQLTLRAFDLLQKADIIFYDSLIDKSILELSQAEKVFVGKRANYHFKLQTDINQLVFEACLKYKTVVRLKGGDPMIFGHAGEEIAFLEAHLISVETVPGVSSPFGAAAWANLPLTLRNISNSVSFCSAHENSKILVPETDTIVYFMGASNLVNIALALKSKQKPLTTPISLFYNIGASDQEIYSETIESILSGNNNFKSPLLAIVGEVGNRNNWYKSFDNKPKVLYTGSHISKYAHLGYVFHQPMIEISRLENFDEVDYEIENLNSYNWLVFTSMYAVEHFFARLFDLGYDSRYLSETKVISIGQVTSGKLKEYGILPDLQAKEESSEGVVKLCEENNIKSKNILIPRSNLALDFLPNSLEELDNVVIKLIVYKNTIPAIINKVEVEDFDQVVFTSPSGVDNFIKIYKKLPQKPELITRGKETGKRIDYYRQIE